MELNNFSDDQILEHLMSLSMFELDEDEKSLLMEKLKFLFHFVDDIKKINTENVEPLYSLTENFNVFRDDEPGENLDHDKALNEAHNILKNENYFTVIKNK